MCPSLPTASPVLVPLPTSLLESFPSSQPLRGTATWKTLFSTPSFSAGIASCSASNGTLSLHRHTQPEIYHILFGHGILQIDGEDHSMAPGMTVLVPGDAEHGVRCDGEEMRWLYVFPGKFEDVEYRFRAEGGYEVKAKL